MRRKVSSLMGFVLLAFGLVLWAVAALALADSERLAKDGAVAQGIVIAADDNQKPVVEFRTGDGRQVRIVGNISASPSPYRVGERIGIFYDPANPTDALIDSFIERWFLPLMFGGFATVLSLVGGLMAFGAMRRGARQRRLLREGRRIDGRIAAFQQVRSGKAGGPQPWVVLVDWTDPQGQARRTPSETLYVDPAGRFKIGDRVTVIADPARPQTGWVDLFGAAGPAAPVAAGTAARASSQAGRQSVLGRKTKTKPPVVRRR